MRRIELFAVGASAGGVDALVGLARALPEDFPGAIFVVLHTPPTARSMLPRILNNAGPLLAAHAVDGEPIEPGRVYVAPPDRHLVVHHGQMRVVNGPRENRHRPAIDPLFRSAAIAYGPRVAGIILSGTLDDGTAGLVAIKRSGGVAIVQDPDEALFPGMIESAIQHVDVDYRLPVEGIADLMARLSTRESPEEGAATVATPDDELVAEERSTEMASTIDPDRARAGVPSVFGCPDCGGVLWDLSDGELLHFRCRVGHAFNAESLLDAQTDQLEAALWSALRALEEKASLAGRLAARASESSQHQAAARYEEERATSAHSAELIRALLLSNGQLSPADLASIGTGNQAAE